MRRKIFLRAFVSIIGILPMAAGWGADDEGIVAGERASAAPEPLASNASLRTTSEKRGWLRDQLARGGNNPWQVRQLQANVDRLTAKQVDELTDAVLAQQLPEDWQQQRAQNAQVDQYRALLLRQVLSDPLAWRRFNRVGYLPIITWLPQGTSLGAGATISPDGRYVRTTVNPFFSSIGPVYTYNLNTGETRLMPPQSPYPNYGSYPLGTPPQNAGYRMGQMPRQHLPPQAPSAYPNVWYDGMRTRVGPRP